MPINIQPNIWFSYNKFISFAIHELALCALLLFFVYTSNKLNAYYSRSCFFFASVCLFRITALISNNWWRDVCRIVVCHIMRFMCIMDVFIVIITYSNKLSVYSTANEWQRECVCVWQQCIVLRQHDIRVIVVIWVWLPDWTFSTLDLSNTNNYHHRINYVEITIWPPYFQA